MISRIHFPPEIPAPITAEDLRRIGFAIITSETTKPRVVPLQEVTP